MKINIGDKIILKKEHPSQTKVWHVIRIGSIYKLQSVSNPKVILEFEKEKLIKQIKNIESEK
ncbi:DUF951 domain-containing protein [Spiroplasma culicicola]|uniref:DUF951 domain-containing protein n=1 Tax=Spiroplasma culicicola AES-1 TaxID=1276246 RepID=W6A8N7_9MOLU|nr:DUF951 domain-containing protein [Spiroplasma culicicola]AHI53382.1 hypothetical protein SCULI_v1c10420 [Spiroplasma culicicola AES-1]